MKAQHVQPGGEIVIYEAKDGSIKLQTKLKDDTIWLPQAEIAELFDVNVPAISKHIKNIYKDGELESKATLSTMEIVRSEGKRSVRRTVEFFNLDMILSIGYRVNSKRATQFRIWATTILRQHLTKGYTLHAERLEGAKLQELKSAVTLIRKAMERRELSADESSGLLKIMTDYAASWSLLDQFERKKIDVPSSKRSGNYVLEYDDVLRIVGALKKHLERRQQANADFGVPQQQTLAAILAAICCLDGDTSESSIESRAAHLLYNLTRSRPFVDGNKRIAAFLFIVYLTRTEYLTGWNGERKFNDTSLVALVLLIAESAEEQKDLMIKLIMNFVHG